MAFEKGVSGNPGGRPKGIKTVKSLLRTAQVLEEHGVHPIAELIALARESDKPEFKREIWLAILPYIEAPQKEPVPMTPQTTEESVEAAAEVMRHLVALSEPLDPTA